MHNLKPLANRPQPQKLLRFIKTTPDYGVKKSFNHDASELLSLDNQNLTQIIRYLKELGKVTKRYKETKVICSKIFK